MKRLMLIIGLVGALAFSGMLFAQEKQEMMHGKQMPMMEMMKDSTMMKQMMKNIAADSHMRQMMMHQMMASVKGDSTGMMQMCKMMMDNPAMHAMMKKMMGGGMMQGGMMKDGKMMHDMQSKSQKKDAPEKEHEHHHHNQ